MVAVRGPPDCRSNVVFHGASRCTDEGKECDGDQGIGRRSQTLVTIFSHCGLRCSRTRVVRVFFLALEGCNRKNFQRSTFHERLKFLLFGWQRVGRANFIAQSKAKEKKNRIMNLSFTNNLWHHFISLIVIYLRLFVYNERWEAVHVPYT